MEETHHILAALVPVILLLALGVGAAIGSRAAGLSPIVGYLALGMALRAAGLETSFDGDTISILAELGVGHREEVLLDPVDRVGDVLEPAEGLALTGAQELLQDHACAPLRWTSQAS